jgi:plastocyanin
MRAGESVNLYSWFVGDQENPTITLAANSPATIMIQNPTETKHELVIESNGQEVASSGDIMSGSSGQLVYTPTAAGTLQYHCEYHPTTMNGTIQVQ